MPTLLDLLKFIDRTWLKRPVLVPIVVPRRGEAQAHAGKYPLDGADIESVSEYRLASLMQYPHY